MIKKNSQDLDDIDNQIDKKPKQVKNIRTAKKKNIIDKNDSDDVDYEEQSKNVKKKKTIAPKKPSKKNIKKNTRENLKKTHRTSSDTVLEIKTMQTAALKQVIDRISTVVSECCLVFIPPPKQNDTVNQSMIFTRR